jgi:hypothetical protein
MELTPRTAWLSGALITMSALTACAAPNPIHLPAEQR